VVWLAGRKTFVKSCALWAANSSGDVKSVKRSL